jgi:hypothetical protein
MHYDYSDDPVAEFLRQAMLPPRLRLTPNYQAKAPQTPSDYDALRAAAERRRVRGLRRLERAATWL